MVIMETNTLNSKSIYYIYGNMDGKNKTVEQDCNDVCAKEVKSVGVFIDGTTRKESVDNTRYFVKCGPDGTFNPLTLDKRMHNRYIKRDMYKWCLVNKQAFDLYLQFLRTGKNQFLHQSERLF